MLQIGIEVTAKSIFWLKMASNINNYVIQF